MKSKTFTRITKVLLLAVLFMMVGVKGWGQLVTYNLSTNGQAHPWPNSTGQLGTFSTNATSPNIASSCANATGWNTDIYWQTSSFNTTGYYNIKVSAKLYSQTSGPLNFSFEYKLGSGGTWTNVLDFAVTSSLATYDFILPSTCHDQSSVFVRWRVRNVTALGGGNIVSTAKSYIKSVSILGTNIVQASNISIVSITPTTITIACSPGTGDKRIVKMNTTNTFTDPTDNYNPTPSTTVYNDGLAAEQVMYNGGTFPSLTLTVANSTNEYWFRIYDYQSNSGSTRYITSTANENPKICALETITPTAATNISLTTAILNATITDPSKMAILDRGIVWSSTSGVSLSDHKTSEGNAATGPFSVDVSGLPRSTTIYFKGYVENESGIILSPELSFSNIPIFSGVGNWETASGWNVNQVPGASLQAPNGSVDDSPIINGTCTQTADNSVTNLTINSGKTLNINPDVSLTVNGDLTNNGGTEGLKLLSTSAGTGSLMHNTASVEATIERFISGTYSLSDKKYHLVSYPFTGSTYKSGVWLDSYLFTYEENNDAWHAWDDPETNDIRNDVGAMVYYPGFYGLNKTYTMRGTLNNSNYSAYVTKTVNKSGFNLAPNPFPSAIDWNNASWIKTSIGSTIYGFNSSTGTYGSYNSVAGGSNGVSNIIPVGQGFFVVATGSNPVLTIPASARLNNNAQVFLKSGQTISNSLHLTANANNGQDEVIVVFTDGGTDSSKDKYDAIKLYSELTVPQLSTHTTIDEAALSINTLPFTEAQTIVPVKLDLDYTGEVLFTASGIESFESGTDIKLEDRLLSKFIDLRSTPAYTFTHTAGDANDRFVLHFGSVLGIEDTESPLLSKVSVSNKTIYLNYPANSMKQTAVLYDIQGRLIKQIQLSNSGYDQISIAFEGVYVLKINLSSNTETHKIVVR